MRWRRPIAFLLSAMIVTSALDAAEKEAAVLLLVPDLASVDRLAEQGYLVDDVEEFDHGVQVRISATAADVEALEAAGYRPYPEPQEPAPAEKQGTVYHTYATMTSALEELSTDYAEITRLVSLGQSVQGRELWALLITDNPTLEEDEPEFKYVSTMHGDEPVGTELCLYLAQHMLASYGEDTRITRLVDETAIWLVPCMNPDGLEAGTRRNALGEDLNRIFPAFGLDFVGTYFDGEPLDLAGRPPEVQHIMNWTVANSFVLSANLHTGALVVNYPYDDDGVPSGVNAPTPDDALIQAISSSYASLNPPMAASAQFPGGITNGCAWYRVLSGMQDWHYRFVGDIETTIELSNIKRPSGNSLPTYWDQNREAMLAYLETVHWGVRGLVVDRATDEPLWARVSIEGIAQPVFSDADVGDFHRLLLPGNYNLYFEVPGYIRYRVHGVVVDDDGATRQDVRLSDGDVNQDGRVDAADVQFAVNALLTGTGEEMSDVDGLGLSATDLQSIINRLLRL